MILVIILLISATLNATDVIVDLKNPIYSDGVLSTTQGGVIRTEGIRIQAKTLCYSKTEDSVLAEGAVMIVFGPHLFVGERITYNFTTDTGVIEDARGALTPWYFGGGTITLLPDGSFQICNATFTTSENRIPDWSLTAESATLLKDHTLYAKNLQMKILNTPLFWFPRFRVNLDFIFDNPIRYYFRVGGKRGTRLGMTYKLYTSGPWDLFFHLDWRLFRGPGGGFETKYLSQDKRIRFDSINYLARDTSIANPIERMRYRLQGAYHHIIPEQKTTINLTYDYLSDKYMATDYIDTTLKFIIPEKTELQIRRQDDLFITNLFTILRANTFQSLKQELPSLEGVIRPINLGSTRFIFEQRSSISYLDYNYSEKLCHTHDFHSFRLSYFPSLYTTFSKGVNITPEAKAILIYFQNSPVKEPQLLTTAFLTVEANTFFYKNTSFGKHVIKPYVLYEGVLSPTSNPNQHYIFDINDGWFRLNTARIGLKQELFKWDQCNRFMRPLECDLFTYAFIHTNTFPNIFPRVYGNITYQITPFFRQMFETAWDLNHHNVAHFNAKFEWTISSFAAFYTEYRHRNAYDFRKVDYFNFIMESYRPENELVHSTLSDKRDTLLCHLFWKFDPEWAIEFTSRSGWLRTCEPNYIEYEVNLIGTLRSAWNVRFAYQYLENDHRFVFGLSLGLKKPNQTLSRTPKVLDY